MNPIALVLLMFQLHVDALAVLVGLSD